MLNEEKYNTCPWCDSDLDEDNKCTSRSCINSPDEYEDDDGEWY